MQSRSRLPRQRSVIVHAVNPPGYRNWEQLVLPMLHNTIHAAERNGALIVLPGTVYNYGPDAFPLAGRRSPKSRHPKRGYTGANGEGAVSLRAAWREGADFAGR